MVKKDKKQVVGELIYGVNPIVELLKAKKRKLISIYTTKPETKAFLEIKELLPKYPVAIQYVSRDVLARMAETTDHQSVVAWVQSYGYRKKMFDPKRESFILLLDGVQDPRNVGAIIRSAYCTGIDGVILPQKNSAPLNSVVHKSSAGLSEHIDIMLSDSSISAIQQVKDAGYEIYLATLGGKNAVEVSYKKPLCLVIGSEGFGISKQLFPFGQQITLPQISKDVSYNASVAAGILLFLIQDKTKSII